MKNTLFYRLSLAATCLALCVTVLGAYVRLSDAGLGCPDWPGCYDQILAPTADHEVHQANQAYPDRPVEVHKAWKEMAHRYLASALGFVILILAFLAIKNKREPNQALWLPLALVLVVCFQGALGMWTVTLLLKPAIVTLHLLGGMFTVALLSWLTLSQKFPKDQRITSSALTKNWAIFALIILCFQISLGGWTSTNYVALHCYDLPTCQGEWLPPMDFKEGFTIWRELGVDYEGGLLSLEAGTAVHLTHRIGAIISLLVIGVLAWLLFQIKQPLAKRLAIILVFVLAAQLTLGLLNIILVLPLVIAVAHNGGAALLLITLVAINRILLTKK
ncbi:MAG: cytochrome c oxidase assembly protein subunit 15 [Oleiphilaceae bacterium]|jgi:cytochrome c oxidase assembly protein subunit 15